MDQQGNVKDSAKPLVNRRTIALGAAWSVPVIVMATAAPAAAASGDVVTSGGGTGTRIVADKEVDFKLTFTSNVATTVSILSVTPDDTWTEVTPTAGPLPVVLSVAPGTAVYSFRLKRSNNAVGSYIVNYSVAGGPVQPASVTIA